jgi:hypothetical protein
MTKSIQILLLWVFLLSLGVTCTYAQTTGDFRSHQTGDWNNVNSWERYDGTSWVTPAPSTPSSADGVITIQSGHNVTVTASDSVDQATIDAGGTVTVNGSPVVFSIKDGPDAVDMAVNGTLIATGTAPASPGPYSVNLSTGAVLSFGSGGIYQHDQNAGAIPVSTWNAGSTFLLTGAVGNAPANGRQDFFNVTWNCPSQTASLNLAWHPTTAGTTGTITIGGDINVLSTGSGRWQMSAPPAGSASAHTAAIININGNINVSGATFTSNGTSNNYTDITINTIRNVDVTGGNFSVSRGSQGGTGTTTWNLNGDFSMSNATTQNSNPAGAKFVFAKAGTQTLTLGAGNTLTSLPLEVSSGTTLNMGTSVLAGSGVFTLNSGATLVCAHANGLNGILTNTGTKTLSAGANYILNGSAAQVTGTLFPSTVNNLTINNAAGVTLTAPTTVNGTLSVLNGNLDLNGSTVTLGPTAALVESGGHTVMGNSGSITTTRTLSPPTGADIAGLGIAITSTSNLGSTTVTRGHAVQTASTGSIKRFFDILPSNNAGLNATLVFRYDPSELNGAVDSTLMLFKSNNGGSSWTPQGGTVDAVAHTITLAGINDLSLWTASLPVAPVASTVAASNVALAGATLNGIVNPNGASTTYYFEYGPSLLYGSTTPQANAGAGWNDVAVNSPVSGLSPGSVYHFRLVTRNAGGTTAANDVIVTTLAPAPELVFPAHGATNQQISLTLRWQSVPSAVRYRLQLATDSLFSAVVFDDSLVTDTSRSVGPLTNSVTYYWRTSTENAGGAGPWSTVQNFTTIASIPGQVQLLSPASGAINQPVSLMLHWQSVPLAVRYRVQVATDSLFSALVLYDSLVTDTTRLTGPLAGNSTYYWRASTNNPVGPGQWSEVWSFTTALSNPNQVQLLSPTNGATDQLVSLALRWQSVPSADSYRVQLATDSLLSAVVLDDSLLTDTTRLVGPLANNTTYYWRASAKNVAGTGQWAAVWDFTTIVSIPTQVQLFSPVSGAANQPVSLTLRWQVVPTAARYRAQLATDSLFSAVVLDDSLVTDTTRPVGPLANNTTYYWRTSAKNAAGTGPWSVAWNFKTIISLPAQVQLVSPANGATLNADSVRCVWTESAPAVSRYWFERGTDSLFTSSVIDSTLTDTSTVTRQLVSNQTYWWRVKAKNPAGWGPYGAQRKFRAVLTDVAGEISAPLEFTLKQNYPNPFNPSTSIDFSVEKPGRATLELYNILGQKLLTLFDEVVEAGRYYTVQFNANGLPSGIYLYKLQSGTKSDMKRLLLIK